MSGLSMPFCTSISSCSILFPCVIPFYYTELDFWTYLFCFLCMYGLLGLLPTSGEYFMSTAPLEIYLLRKMVTCSILILPAIYIYTSIKCRYVCIDIFWLNVVDCQHGPNALNGLLLFLWLCIVNKGRELLSLYYLLFSPVMCMFICY